MDDDTNVEFDSKGRPLVSSFDELASVFLLLFLVLFFYSLSLALGFNFEDVFRQSPLVKFFGLIAGFLAAAISWVPAFLIFGIVIGDFDFAKEVYKLYSQNDFRIAMGLVILFLPIAKFATRTIMRTAFSYKARTWIFYFAFTLSIASSFFAVSHISLQVNEGAYYFSFGVIGFLYLGILQSGLETH